ncbi:hypothetical protein DVH24_032476 [Malus domestica]|uniref:Uncharacterized protein n=1 Tax=Malus domestica TaxID=3750 RepID=A0A498J2X5_MALDO|nr:hypothetical protein DVH24_032476 [Malus domestica]
MLDILPSSYIVFLTAKTLNALLASTLPVFLLASYAKISSILPTAATVCIHSRFKTSLPFSMLFIMFDHNNVMRDN